MTQSRDSTIRDSCVLAKRACALAFQAEEALVHIEQVLDVLDPQQNDFLPASRLNLSR